jgi:nucleoside-diphosphate-sugar epimerase
VASEQIFLRELSEGSVSPNIIRFGLLYGPESYFMKKLADYLYKEKIPTLDGGTNKVSMTHGSYLLLLFLIPDNDAARAIVTLAEHLANTRSSGVYHVTDDHPIELGAVLHRLAIEIGANEPADYPSWLASFKVRYCTLRRVFQHFLVAMCCRS